MIRLLQECCPECRELDARRDAAEAAAAEAARLAAPPQCTDPQCPVWH